MYENMTDFIKNITKKIFYCTAITVAVAQTAQSAESSLSPTLWQKEGCIVQNNNKNTILQTTGHLSGNTLQIRVTLKQPVKGTPHITFNAKRDTPIYLEGASNNYAFELPYTAHDVADLLHKNSVMIMGYQLKGSDVHYYETFDTNTLVPLISSLSKKCH